MVPQQPPTTLTPSSDDEAPEMGGEVIGTEVVDHLPVFDVREPGVGYRRHRDGRVPGEVAQGLEHLGGAGGAVEPDHIGVKGLDAGEGGADLGPGQHPAGQLDGDLHLHRQVDAGSPHRLPGALDRGLGAEEVELGLDDHQVDSTVDQASGLLLRTPRRARHM